MGGKNKYGRRKKKKPIVLKVGKTTLCYSKYNCSSGRKMTSHPLIYVAATGQGNHCGGEICKCRVKKRVWIKKGGNHNKGGEGGKKFLPCEVTLGGEVLGVERRQLIKLLHGRKEGTLTTRHGRFFFEKGDRGKSHYFPGGLLQTLGTGGRETSDRKEVITIVKGKKRAAWDEREYPTTGGLDCLPSSANPGEGKGGALVDTGILNLKPGRREKSRYRLCASKNTFTKFVPNVGGGNAEPGHPD